MTKRSFFLGFLAFIFSSAIYASAIMTVNVPVATMFKYGNNQSPVISQAIYGTGVKVLDQAKGFVEIQTPDNYIGWVAKTDLFNAAPYKGKDVVEVYNLFANVYSDPDMSLHKPIFTLPFSTRLQFIKEMPNEYMAVKLANGKTGYILRGDLKFDPKPISMDEMLVLSKRFIGLPYTWGGVSSYGFDCSGFTQMLFKQMGYMIPRDTGIQVNWSGFQPVKRDQLEPGDLIYFGFDNRVSHVGIYLGDNKFINDTAYKSPMVQISDLTLPHWQQMYMTARRLKIGSKATSGFNANISPIPDDVAKKMQKYTWKKGCPVPIEDLAYIRMTYWGYDNKPHQGTLIVNKYLAKEVVDIFHDLYSKKFPIQSMKPMSEFKGDDEASMRVNNTSAFNCRAMTDFPDQYSIHSYGGAIDINPLINPYHYKDKIDPPEGKQYLDRSVPFKGKITDDSDIVKIFTAHGWVWGGSWPNMKDYQHFEKPLKQN